MEEKLVISVQKKFENEAIAVHHSNFAWTHNF